MSRNGKGRRSGEGGGEEELHQRATTSALWMDRSHRSRLRVEGRAPARMLTGIVTGRVPGPLEGPIGRPIETPLEGDGTLVRRGWRFPSAILTPKGKIVSEVWLHRLESGEEGAFLLDLPAEGLEGLLDHFRRYLPPRFARVVDVSGELGLLTVVGPESPRLLAELPGLEALGEEALAGMEEGEERILGPAGSLTGGLRVVRNGEVDPPAYDLLGELGDLRRLREGLTQAGLAEADPSLWEILRVEKGRPVFGRELDPEIIPPEAGLQERWIDHQKGCYTGQEVIVRIRDRGRVNRHLRGILLGEGEGAEPGTPLFVPGRERSAGELRSVVRSPRFGQVVALAYVRREVQPPGEVYIGGPGGPPGQVRALTDHGWVLVPGDPGA
jgi:tRNA-modifying protein YgfZ